MAAPSRCWQQSLLPATYNISLAETADLCQLPAAHGFVNLFSRRAVGRRIGGRRWPSCATKHRLSRELFRARYYHKRGRFSRRSSNRENTPNKKRASSFMTALPPPIFPNLPTLPKVKNKGPPTDGMSSTAIAIAITIALTCQIIQRLHKNFSLKSNVCTSTIHKNTQARKTTHSYNKWWQKLQYQSFTRLSRSSLP